ncbi:flagellar hook protein FlgE, partial [Campylobacter molothri]|uniref:flagellar hook protein FlgE n=2 Tax=Campylobacter molothri TaxID=1032242 RepID=UPI00301C9798|nr:flagellar hook protein FlgE [Campylobacter sp. RM17709]
MHIPAAKSTEVAIKANLNSGLNIGTASRPLYSLDSIHGYNKKTGETKDENDTGTTQFYTTSKNAIDVTEKGVDCASLFNASGQGLNLREGQGIWVSYADAKYQTNKVGASAFDENKHQNQTAAFWGNANQKTTLSIVLNGVKIENKDITSIDQAVNYINTFTVANDSRPGTGVKAVKSKDGSGIEFVNDNSNGTTDNMKNINLVVNSDNTAGELWNAKWDNNENKFTFNQNDPQINKNGTSLWTADKMTPTPDGAKQVTLTGKDNVSIITAHKYIYSSSAQDLPPMYNPDGGFNYVQGTGADNPAWNGTTDADVGSKNYYDAVHNGALLNTDARTFHSTEDLRELLQRDARYGVDYDGSGSFAANDVNEAVKVVVNDSGAFSITNPNGETKSPPLFNNGNQLTFNAHNMSFNITSYTDSQGKVSTNDAFTKIFKGLDGVFPAGNQVKQSELLKLSSFSAGLEIYDSLGSKHTLEVQFVKQSTTQDGGNEWQMIIRVPEPAEINTTGEGPSNIVVGTARFNNDGSLSSYNPRTLNFSPNNGAAPNQQIKLSFGTSGANDGLVSSNSASALTSQATDGYPSGNLKPDAIRVDDKGNILGEFTNGKTFAVAKMAMASVANNSGLEEIGGNLFKVTANSGNIVVGEAGTGGRGDMKTSALEMSNVDLSRSLTELIIIQRGYQANSKTISTSDQMLQTLIQLKQ